MAHTGPQFLHERDPSLHASPDVEHTVAYLNTQLREDRRQDPEAGVKTIPNEPLAKISAYLGFLADKQHANDGLLTGDEPSLQRQIERQIIDGEAVPEAYYELQRRIAREQGHGNVEITDDLRTEYLGVLQQDQRESLRSWTDYLTGDASDIYPDWFKEYVFDSVVRLADYDKRKKLFKVRTEGTAAKFPDLNREALSIVYDHAQTKSEALAKQVRNKKLPKGQRSALTPEEQAALGETTNFNKLYSNAMREAVSGYPTPEELAVTDGSWRTFSQSDRPEDVRKLMMSLRGRGTGWCTSGEGYASAQLQAGDFMIYFTEDSRGEPRVPRIAIRMQQGEVIEVRGIVGGGDGAGPAENTDQELESSMLDIAAAKLQDLPGGEVYLKRTADMKHLTALEQRVKADPDAELSQADLRFLYELDSSIEGFGYSRDPRIDEVRKLRGERDKPELARILPEAIREQLQAAFGAYRTVAEQLASPGRRGLLRRHVEVDALSEHELTRLFKQKDKEWQANGIYDYLVEQLITTGARYNLVATPNLEASEEQLVALAEKFGEDQPYQTYIYDDMYRQGRYSAGEWSGNEGSQAVRFSLIPSAYDKELGFKSAPEQLAMLRERQAQRPRLNFRVPSVLDAVSYWYALRARGDKLVGDTTFDKTYIRHFDMEPKAVGGWRRVPRSFVDDRGWPGLESDGAERGDDARVAVG